MNQDKTVDRHVIALDDEPMFLTFAGIPFRTGFCGFCTWHVHAFTDPAEALGFYRERGGAVDVVLTDYHMPTMNGAEFISQLRAIPTARQDQVPAMIVTSDPLAGTALPAGVKVVRKPFTKDDIAGALCELSVVCETGSCPGHACRTKPRPPAGIMRPRLTGDKTEVYG